MPARTREAPTTPRPPAAVRRILGAHRGFEVGGRTAVMGVVNVTPDSFSDGGRFRDASAAVDHGLRLLEEGAAILDIGGESTRPGATPVSPEEEWRRIGPVLEGLASKGALPLSVDTTHAEVARRAIAAGADVVNDVDALSDPEMRSVVVETGAAAILMHRRGTPSTMQRLTEYRDLRAEVFGALRTAAERAEADGVPRSKLLLDPGLGFAKTAAQSLELLTHLGELRGIGYPVVVGASRKSFLAPIGGGDRPSDRLEGSLAAAVVASLAGVEVVRAHDVRATVRAVAVADAVRGRTGAE